MALQLIIGGSGAGKSYCLQQQIIRDSIAHPRERYVLLVPEQFTMQTQKDLVTRHPAHGIMNIDVQSFQRPAYHVFDEVGGSRKVLEETGKSLVIRRLAQQNREKLTLLGSKLERMGYVGEMKSVLSELTQYRVGPELLEKLQAQGVNLAYVTLHVGLGTFRPVKAEEITDHHMHSEFCMMSAETAELLNRTHREGHRIVCVGTTSCRTVESLVEPDGTFREKSAWTDIFIYPGYKFRALDALITNFHLPESTLVMLVSALAGRENILHAYQVAVQEKYRFFSFGDAMFIH